LPEEPSVKVFVLIAHQKRGSFCHAIAATAVAELRSRGHEVVFHDLYAEAFDPILPDEEIPKGSPAHPVVQQHCREGSAADGFVVIHPNWWGQPPAILKGWLDRVLRQGVAYEFSASGVVGLLKRKRALVFTTSNTPREAELELFGDPLENLWQNCVFRFCGIDEFRRRNFEPVIVSTLEQRQQWLAEVQRLVGEQFPVAP
jgi:NAD(P)H dehydrogenase (quinone)